MRRLRCYFRIMLVVQVIVGCIFQYDAPNVFGEVDCMLHHDFISDTVKSFSTQQQEPIRRNHKLLSRCPMHVCPWRANRPLQKHRGWCVVCKPPPQK